MEVFFTEDSFLSRRLDQGQEELHDMCTHAPEGMGIVSQIAPVLDKTLMNR